jgi:hypothetical protein
MLLAHFKFMTKQTTKAMLPGSVSLYLSDSVESSLLALANIHAVLGADYNTLFQLCLPHQRNIDTVCRTDSQKRHEAANHSFAQSRARLDELVQGDSNSHGSSLLTKRK